MRVLSVIGLVLLASGCQSIKDMSRHELAWQSLHAVDIAQTLNAANDPCYIEAFPVTQSLIGEQPSNSEVFAWGIGTAVGHYLVTQGLQYANAPTWLQKVWGYTTIGHTAYTVADNHRNGVRMFGDNSDVNGCY